MQKHASSTEEKHDAHKATNKITSIIYALTLGCVIFLCVAVNLIVNAVQCVGTATFPDADIYISDQNSANTFGSI